MANNTVIHRVPENLLHKVGCSRPNDLDARIRAVCRMYLKNRNADIGYTKTEIWLACIRFHFAGEAGLAQFNRVRKQQREQRQKKIKIIKQPVQLQLALLF